VLAHWKDDTESAAKTKLGYTLRASYGAAMCRFRKALQGDVKVQYPQTLVQMLAAAREIETAMSCIFDELDESDQEGFAWQVMNGTVHLYSICEPLSSLGFSRQVVEFFNWSVLSMEGIVNLCTTKYLRWRLRIYAMCCQCYLDMAEQSNNNHAFITAAGKVVERAADKVMQLKLEEEQDLPLPPGFNELLAEVGAVLNKLEVAVTLRGGKVRNCMSAAASAAAAETTTTKSSPRAEDSNEGGEATAVIQQALSTWSASTTTKDWRRRFEALSEILMASDRRVLTQLPPRPHEEQRVEAVFRELKEVCPTIADLIMQQIPKSYGGALASPRPEGEEQPQAAEEAVATDVDGEDKTSPRASEGGKSPRASDGSKSPRAAAEATKAEEEKPNPLEPLGAEGDKFDEFFPVAVHVSLMKGLFSYAEKELFVLLAPCAQARLQVQEGREGKEGGNEGRKEGKKVVKEGREEGRKYTHTHIYLTSYTHTHIYIFDSFTSVLHPLYALSQ
jgi:hypothetical protein